MSIDLPEPRRPLGDPPSTVAPDPIAVPELTLVGDRGRRSNALLEGCAPFGAGHDDLVSLLADACAPARPLELRGGRDALAAFRIARGSRPRLPVAGGNRRPAARRALRPTRNAGGLAPLVGSTVAAAACAAIMVLVGSGSLGMAGPPVASGPTPAGAAPSATAPVQQPSAPAGQTGLVAGSVPAVTTRSPSVGPTGVPEPEPVVLPPAGGVQVAGGGARPVSPNPRALTQPSATSTSAPGSPSGHPSVPSDSASKTTSGHASPSETSPTSTRAGRGAGRAEGDRSRRRSRDTTRELLRQRRHGERLTGESDGARAGSSATGGASSTTLPSASPRSTPRLVVIGSFRVLSWAQGESLPLVLRGACLNWTEGQAGRAEAAGLLELAGDAGTLGLLCEDLLVRTADGARGTGSRSESSRARPHPGGDHRDQVGLLDRAHQP